MAVLTELDTETQFLVKAFARGLESTAEVRRNLEAQKVKDGSPILLPATNPSLTTEQRAAASLRIVLSN